MDLLESLTKPLEYAGGIEEKFGGRAIRGLLGGKPRELLSVVPFSDTLGITEPRRPGDRQRSGQPIRIGKG